MNLEDFASHPGDCWAALRARAAEMSPGEQLAVRFGSGSGFRLRRSDIRNLLRLTGFEPGRTRRSESGYEMVAVRVPRSQQPLSCSVIVPCRNEVDNVGPLVARLPQLGTHTELIFVDGSSTDGTPERIEALIRSHPHRDIKLLHQRNIGGKAAAVFQGFDAAGGDVVMILDADMTVAPEDLPRFYLALAEGVADFANGTRFVYPMQSDAMPPLNVAGNRVFSLFFAWLLRSRISDSLCGTKALRRADWARIREVRPLFGGYDPWGDFDLLLGAAHIGLRIVDVPVPYYARTAGESKMHPLTHGWILLRTCLVGAQRLKLERWMSGSR